MREDINYMILDPEDELWQIHKTEDGGVRFRSKFTDGWCYSDDEDDVVDIIERFGAVDEWIEDHSEIRL